MKRGYQSGVTLIEMMLVLAIMATMMLYGVNIYRQYQTQLYERKIADNVNQLFQAMEGYYFSNCRQTRDASSNPQTAGRLDPVVVDASGTQQRVAIQISKELMDGGFIKAAVWHPENPLLDAKQGETGYFIQYNRVISGGVLPVKNVFACTGSTKSPSCDRVDGVALQATLQTNTQTARVTSWVMQVAVKLASNNQIDWNRVKNDLNATCISDTSGFSIVTSCTAAPKENGYLVWLRMPSSHPDTMSDISSSMPYVNQFNMQYTNDGMATLGGVKNETNNWYNTLNYLCGG